MAPAAAEVVRAGFPGPSAFRVPLTVSTAFLDNHDNSYQPVTVSLSMSPEIAASLRLAESEAEPFLRGATLCLRVLGPDCRSPMFE